MNKIAVITMDVEDWYQGYYAGMDVDKTQSVLDGLDVALEIMDQKNIKGSFFVVGEIADKIAKKIRMMDQNGHEIACHSWDHAKTIDMPIDTYKNDLRKTKAKLESILGHEVIGYRAPFFNIDDTHFDVMRSCGFKYDSSKLKPQKSKKYGSLSLEGFQEIVPAVFRSGDFTEFEVSTQKIGSMNMLLTGGYIRILPWCFMKWMTNRYLKTGNLYVMYIHPIDLSSKTLPHVHGDNANRYLRSHVGRKDMINRFKTVVDLLKMNGYHFSTFKNLLNSYQ